MNEQIELQCADGVELAADWTPAAAACGSVVVAAATGVGRAYYGKFSDYLASRGLNVLRFDYRGIGGSRDAAKRHSFDMRTWAEQDLVAAIAEAEQRGNGLPVLQVGHSFGGQALGLAPNNITVRALLGISAQSGHWRNWRGHYRMKMWATMHLVLPAVSAITGDLPAGMMGKDPLPRDVVRQWAGWCRGPHYMCDGKGYPLRDGFQRWQGKVRLYHIADDHMYAPLPAVQELGRFYCNADIEVISRTPRDWGSDTIEHFGFFRPALKAGWDEAADWLLQQAAAAR